MTEPNGEQTLAISWNDIPISPRRWPFFYGWVIAATGTLGLLASIPGQTMGVGVFTDHLIAALHLTRTELSTAYMLGTIGSSLLLPFAGSLLDRFGGRVMLVTASLGLGVSVAALSQIGQVVGVERSFAVAMVVSFFCFLCMRFFGQGCLAMVSRVALGKWFNHRRGLATAISSVFVSFGFNGSPRLLNWLVEHYGWRGACLAMAVAVGLGMSLIGWIFFRDNPEQCGLVMDGVTDKAWHEKMAAKVAEVRKEFTRREALRTPAFWAFNLGVATQALVVTGLTFHISSIGASMGLSRDQSYDVFLPMAVFSVCCTFAGGWLSDRIKLKWLLLVMMVAQAIGSAGLASFGETAGWWLLVVGYGVSGGLFAVLVTVTWPRYFGRLHLGAISGLNMSAMVFASAIAPAMFSVLYSWTGSYRMVAVLCWCMPVAVIVATLKAENPQETA